MKNKKNWIAIVVLLVLVIAAISCYFVFRPQPVSGEKTITVQVTHLDGSSNVFEITTQEQFLSGAMQQEKLLEGTDGPYGLFVLTVDGEFADEEQSRWWTYTKSGEYVEYGVDQCVIEDGDRYEFFIYTGE